MGVLCVPNACFAMEEASRGISGPRGCGWEVGWSGWEVGTRGWRVGVRWQARLGGRWRGISGPRAPVGGSREPVGESERAVGGSREPVGRSLVTGARPPSGETAGVAGRVARGLKLGATRASLACFEIALAAQTGMQRSQLPSGALCEAKFSRALAWCLLYCNIELKVRPELTSVLRDAVYSTMSGLANCVFRYLQSHSKRACSSRLQSRGPRRRKAQVPPRPDPFFAPHEINPNGWPLRRSEGSYPRQVDPSASIGGSGHTRRSGFNKVD